ncbi:MAG: hypothetical protein AAF620_01035 [Bacteroidota bacterium]
MNKLLSLDELSKCYEAIDMPHMAKILRVVKSQPDYSLVFQNELFRNHKHKFDIKSGRSLTPIIKGNDPFYINTINQLIEWMNKLNCQIYRPINELISVSELQQFIRVWNKRVNIANEQGLTLTELNDREGIHPINLYCHIKLTHLARHRDRRISSHKRYNRKYHLEDERTFNAYIQERYEAHLSNKKRMNRVLAERRFKAKSDRKLSKAEKYYGKKVPLFKDELLQKNKDIILYSSGISSVKRIVF